MKKVVLNIGKILSKAEQKQIKGSRKARLRCCEWCHDDSCYYWEEIGITCPFTPSC